MGRQNSFNNTAICRTTHLLLSVVGELLVHEHLERLGGHSAGQRVAAEGAAVLSGLEGHHDLVVGQNRGDGHGASG